MLVRRDAALRWMRSMSVWALLIVLTCCAPVHTVGEGHAGNSSGFLAGRAMRGPLSPVGGLPGKADVEAVAGARVQAVRDDRKVTREAVTNSDGHYRLALPEGSYHITVEKLRPGEFAKSLPASVTVVAGRETRFDIWIDTGIR